MFDPPRSQGEHVAHFDGQVAVVTGAGGGLGREYALLLAGEGAKVVVNDYGGDTVGHRGSSAMAEAVVKEIREAGGQAVADSSDVASEGADVVAKAMSEYGGLHIVVNNAGIAGGGTLDTIPVAEYDRMLAIHLGGTLSVARAAWPVFCDQSYGRIVNTSSASVFGLPGTSAYITAKAAIFGLTRALAHDGRSLDIKVNGIMPSAYSRLTQQSEEFAPVMAAGFPAARAAPFVAALVTRAVPCTGETFVVGGGRAARVVIATVPGVLYQNSIDECLATFPEVLAIDDLYVPGDAVAAVIYECQQLGVDISSLGV
jgi:NAD(P)-dependent dehydrogenase (short-subunit alcohol dehydrogenase family)